MSNTFEQSHAIRDPEARGCWVSNGDHQDRCAVCHRPLSKPDWLGFTVHHIIQGPGRSDEPYNFSLLCARCHNMAHSGKFRDERTGELLPDITLGMVLWIKSHTEEWNPERLRELHHRNLPDLEPLPDYYLRERERWDYPKTCEPD